VRHTLLIIDDSKMVHRLVAAWLKEDPVECVFCDNGADGLKMAANLHPDLILLDVDMPKQNGFDVCRLLKADERTAKIPVIFLTAVAAVQEKISGLELGADDYITKPFNPGELRARVKALLRRAA